MFLFAENGIPVIHLLDVVRIAEKYNLPIAPDYHFFRSFSAKIEKGRSGIKLK